MNFLELHRKEYEELLLSQKSQESREVLFYGQTTSIDRYFQRRSAIQQQMYVAKREKHIECHWTEADKNYGLSKTKVNDRFLNFSRKEEHVLTMLAISRHLLLLTACALRCALFDDAKGRIFTTVALAVALSRPNENPGATRAHLMFAMVWIRFRYRDTGGRKEQT